MQILVAGSLRNVPRYGDICKDFVSQLASIIVNKEHVLLTGCRGSLDLAIAESAHKCLVVANKDDRAQLKSYLSKNAVQVHNYGAIYTSYLEDWELTHPVLDPPEQIKEAHVVIIIAGTEGTFIAANWARIAGKPVLGVTQFGGAGEALYWSEYQLFNQKYTNSITKKDYEVLNQTTRDVNLLAKEVIKLAEKIVTPKKVFTAMPFSDEFLDVFACYQEVCSEWGLDADRTDQSESSERIVPRIIEGTRASAFVIVDLSDLKPNVCYELGLAEGFGKRVILTMRKRTELPFDIADKPVIFWKGRKKFKEELRKRIEGILKELPQYAIYRVQPHDSG